MGGLGFSPTVLSIESGVGVDADAFWRWERQVPSIVVLRLSMDEVGVLSRCIEATLSRLDDDELLTEIGETRRALLRFARLLEMRGINARHNRQSTR